MYIDLSGLMPNPRLFCLEAGEQAGKSLQSTRLPAALVHRGWHMEVFREPGSTALAETLRTVWRDPELDVVDPLTATLLMFAARRDTIEQSMRPYLAAHPHGLALLDRSFWSTLVYQNQTPPAVLETLVRTICAEMIPTRTYLLDLDPQVALARRAHMSDLDRFDLRGLDWHEGIRARYLELAHAYPALFCIIDAAQEPAAVTQAILDDLLPLLTEPASV